MTHRKLEGQLLRDEYMLLPDGSIRPILTWKEHKAMWNSPTRWLWNDKVSGEKEVITIDTSFLISDHFGKPGQPILWETMVFGGIHNWYQERYTSHQAAREGHKCVVEMVKASLGLNSDLYDI